jgi:hypothetical protein
LGEKPRGVYFEGIAEMLSDVNENNSVYQLFVDRLGVGPEVLGLAQQADGPHFYKVSVADWYMFDARESKPAQKYHLDR